MLPPSEPDHIRIAFDDHRLVANAGLILPVTFAQRLGLRELAGKHVDLGDAPGRANTGDKMLTPVASALAGGDCIDDADVLRTGGTAGAGCIGPDDLEPGESSQQLGQHQARLRHGPGCWPHAPPRPRAARWCPLRYGACVPTPFCLRHSREAPFFRGFHRLAVDDGPARGGIPSLALPDHGAQCLLHPLPSAVFAPFPEVPPDSAPRRQVMGHHSPGYAATQNVQYAVNHLPQV